jgi:hypothetical protein
MERVALEGVCLLVLPSFSLTHSTNAPQSFLSTCYSYQHKQVKRENVPKSGNPRELCRKMFFIFIFFMKLLMSEERLAKP